MTCKRSSYENSNLSEGASFFVRQWLAGGCRNYRTHSLSSGKTNFLTLTNGMQSLEICQPCTLKVAGTIALDFPGMPKARSVDMIYYTAYIQRHQAPRHQQCTIP